MCLSLLFVQLGFVHFDQTDQKKYLAVLSRLSEGGAIDELGIGRIRDFYSDRLFPGISTLHQHAKYFSLMPLLYREAVKGNKYYRLEDVRPAIRYLEIEMTKRLCKGSPGAYGITGSDSIQSGNYVKYDPAYIYGTALRTYGIVRTDNIESVIFYASKKYHERPVKLSATDQEQGDSDDVDSVFSFCVCPSNLEYNWLAECSLELTPNEASFIREHILAAKACENTLLHYILENKLFLRDDDVSSLESFLALHGSRLPEKLKNDITLASHFSDLVDGLFLYYNWLFSEKTDMKVWKEFQAWREDIFLHERNGMMESVTLPIISDNGPKRFCQEAIRLIESEDWTQMDRLVKNRERSIKGSRYKIGNAKGRQLYEETGRIHGYKVDFRWGKVRILVNEILGGLGDE